MILPANMRLKVEVTKRAEADIDQAYRYIRDHDGPGRAAKWREGLYPVIERLMEFPRRLAHAPENNGTGTEVRQLHYNSYRVLFTIEGNRVVVFTVRHAARLPLPPEDLG